MKPRVGFAGLGIMGKLMAANIAKAGYEVAVYNRTRPKPQDAPGMTVAETPKQLAKDNDVLVIMVTGPQAVDDLVWGENGMGGSLGPGKVIINMSTVSPAYCADLNKKIAATGATLVDAPVSGSKVPAQMGTLVILAGGPKKTVDELEPLFLTMGKQVVHCGQAPQGTMMKMAINLLLANFMCSLAEMINFGQAGGLTMDAMLEVVLGGPMSCELYKIKEPLMRKAEYTPQFPLKHMHKDLKFVLDTAVALNCPAPSVFTNLQLFSQGMAKGLGELDFAAVKQVLESMA
jgi:3-hydroxyisobutyrate dehydrogenase-like beta-hydroxyacid dehydrogenase